MSSKSVKRRLVCSRVLGEMGMIRVHRDKNYEEIKYMQVSIRNEIYQAGFSYRLTSQTQSIFQGPNKTRLFCDLL